MLETKKKSDVDIILLSAHVFFPQIFSWYSKKKAKLGSLLWSRLQDSLGFHLHTHITIISSSALYLLKSAIKIEWLQKKLRGVDYVQLSAPTDSKGPEDLVDFIVLS